MGQKTIDLIGKKFGKLIVVKREYPNRGKQSIYLCKCDCGTEKIIRGNNLKSGGTKSCGCLAYSNGIRYLSGFASMRGLIYCYKKNAEKRGYTWELTEEQFAKITQKECHYCGAKPNNIFKQRKCNGDYIYNGLDRIDNTKNYTVENTVSCCKTCNHAKGILTLQEFKEWIKRIYNKIFGDNNGDN